MVPAGDARTVSAPPGALRVSVVIPAYNEGEAIVLNPFYVGSLWRDRGFARAVCAELPKRHFDLVQSHERIPGCSVYRAGDGVHRRWLEIRRATAGLGERLGIALNPYHRYVCAMEKRMFEHPRLRAVICNSRMVRDEIARMFRIDPQKLHVVHNGVDTEQFHPRNRAQLRDPARAGIGDRSHRASTRAPTR